MDEIDFNTVKRHAAGRWPEIWRELGITDITANGKHGPCPGCGGRDRFRTVLDESDTGGWVCGQGGDPTGGDGFDLLQHVHGWTPGDALKAVAECVGLGGKGDDAAKGRRGSLTNEPVSSTPPAKKQTPPASLRRVIESAAPAKEDHPYLVRKEVDPSGLLELPAPNLANLLGYKPKAGDAALAGRVLIAPVIDLEGLRSLEMIDEEGRKTALARATRKGAWWQSEDLERPEVIAIGEGIATAKSIAAATGWPAVAALSCSNLRNVAQAMKEQHPTARLVICADRGNGEDAARKAARKVGAALAVPDIQPEQGSDFNDLATAEDLEAVRKQIEGAQEVGPIYLVDGQEWLQPPVSGAEIRTEPPSVEERPRWACYLRPNRDKGINRAGVWYHGLKQGKNDEPPKTFDEWLCSPLLIEATTKDRHGCNYGRLLRYRVDGKWKRWNMPMPLLAGDGVEIARELYRDGVMIQPRMQRRLSDYLASIIPRRKVCAALEIGWHDRAFVLPDQVFGDGEIFFQSATVVVSDFSATSTLAAWQNEIASKAVGNPPLIFAISVAMAGPLLHLVHLEGCGFHLVGGSSCGKTTALQAAVSVWGPPTLKRTWRGTSNGLEAAAAEANDLALFLDEIGECAPRDVGRVVYALGNGTGKARANVTGHSRTVRRWRTVVLSTGEKTLETVLTEAGERVTAGQDLRLLSIPADGFNHGTFACLHGAPTGGHLADEIKTAANNHYGTAGRAWLNWLVKRLDLDYSGKLKAQAKSLAPTNGQEERAARMFGLVAMAGELAIEAGILPWEQGTATAAAADLWGRWRAHRGQAPGELRQVVEALRDYILRYQDRMENLEVNDMDRIINDRVGYIRGNCYHLLPGAFKEAVSGTDPTIAKRLLKDAGLLRTNVKQKMISKLKVAGKTITVVSLHDEILNYDPAEDHTVPQVTHGPTGSPLPWTNQGETVTH